MGSTPRSSHWFAGDLPLRQTPQNGKMRTSSDPAHWTRPVVATHPTIAPGKMPNMCSKPSSSVDFHRSSVGLGALGSSVVAGADLIPKFDDISNLEQKGRFGFRHADVR